MLKFFDCNCMVGRIAGRNLQFDNAKNLLEDMRYYNIGKALVFHSLAWQYNCSYGNELLLKEIKGRSSLYPAAVVSAWDTPEGTFSDKLKDFIRTRVYAIRMFPAGDNFEFSERNLRELLKLANKARLPVIIDYEQLKSISEFKEMLSRYAGIPFILSKISYGNSRILYPLLKEYKNLHIELSLFRLYQGVEGIVKHVGPDRVLFGSGMPLLDAGAVACRIIYSGISGQDKKKIAYGNMDRILSGIRR